MYYTASERIWTVDVLHSCLPNFSIWTPVFQRFLFGEHVPLTKFIAVIENLESPQIFLVLEKWLNVPKFLEKGIGKSLKFSCPCKPSILTPGSGRVCIYYEVWRIL